MKKPWWKVQEEVSHLFETVFRPFEAEVLRDTRQRDIVGRLRQLDVGVLDSQSGERRVKAFVEVQKRKEKVGIEDFGSWIYKKETLKADELVVVSEAGFTSSVIRHAKELHPNSVRLGRLHSIDSGYLRDFDSTCLGLTRILDIWFFASIFLVFAGSRDVSWIKIPDDTEEKLFGSASPMDIVRNVEEQAGEAPPGQFVSYVVDVKHIGLSFEGRLIDNILLTAEKQRRIWDPLTEFFSYEEIFPEITQRGIALLSEFKLDSQRNGRLILILTPDLANRDGRMCRVAGQFEVE